MKLNPLLCYKKPSSRNTFVFQNIPGWTDTLATMCRDVLKLSEEHFTCLKGKFDEHVGEKSTYKGKKGLMEGTQEIYLRLRKMTNPDSKMATIQKLYEGAIYCTPGFYNRVSELLNGFYLPQTIDDLFLKVREGIVERVARSQGADVHIYNTFFKEAAELYKVRELNKDDPHQANANSKPIPAARIHELLKVAFDEHYQIAGCLNQLIDGIKGVLYLNFDYFGAKKEGYAYATHKDWEPYLNALLGASWNSDQYLLKSGEDGHCIYDLNWPKIKQGLFDILLARNYFLKVAKEPMNLMFRKEQQDVYLAGARSDALDKEMGITVLKGIPLGIEIKEIALFVKELTNGDPRQLAQLLFFFNGFSLETKSKLILSCVVESSEPHKLTKLIEVLEFFKNDKDLFEKAALLLKEHFTVTVEELINYVEEPEESLSRVNFLFRALQRNLPLHFILFFLSQSDNLEIQLALTYCNEKSKDNCLLYSVWRRPERVASLLQLMKKLPIISQYNILASVDINSWGVLAHAVRHNSEVVGIILGRIDEIESKFQVDQLFTKRYSVERKHYSLLELAAEFHPKIIPLLLQSIIRLPSLEQERVTGIDTSLTALMYALKKYPPALEPLLNTLSKLSIHKQGFELRLDLRNESPLLTALELKSPSVKKILEMMEVALKADEQIAVFKKVKWADLSPEVRLLLLKNIFKFKLKEQQQALGGATVLLYVLQKSQTLVEPVLDLISKLAIERQTEELTPVVSEKFFWQLPLLPGALKKALGIIETLYSIEEQKTILQDMQWDVYLEEKRIILFKYIINKFPMEDWQDLFDLEDGCILKVVIANFPEALDSFLDRCLQLTPAQQKIVVDNLDKNEPYLLALESHLEKMLDLMARNLPAQEQMAMFRLQRDRDDKRTVGSILLDTKKNQPLLLKHLLKFPLQEQQEICGPGGVLNYALEHGLDIDFHLDHVSRCTPEQRNNLFLLKNAQGYNALLLAGRNSPQFIAKLWNLMTPDQQAMAFQQAVFSSKEKAQTVAYWPASLQRKFFNACQNAREQQVFIANMVRSQAPIQIEFYQFPEVIACAHSMLKNNHKDFSVEKRAALELKLVLQLAQLELKAKQLPDGDDKSPRKMVERLYKDLLTPYNTYRNSERIKKDVLDLQNKWTPLTFDPKLRSVLIPHRGVKDILTILMLCLTGIGGIYVAYRFFFRDTGKPFALTETDSIKKVSAFDETTVDFYVG